MWGPTWKKNGAVRCYAESPFDGKNLRCCRADISPPRVFLPRSCSSDPPRARPARDAAETTRWRCRMVLSLIIRKSRRPIKLVRERGPQHTAECKSVLIIIILIIFLIIKNTHISEFFLGSQTGNALQEMCVYEDLSCWWERFGTPGCFGDGVAHPPPKRRDSKMLK